MVWSCFFPIRPQYRTGKTLGSGTYAIVKEAVHIRTGKYYACKVINKKLMEGREYMVRPRRLLTCARPPRVDLLSLRSLPRRRQDVVLIP